MRTILILLVLVLSGALLYQSFFRTTEPTPAPQEQPNEPIETKVVSDNGEILLIEYPKKNDKISSPLVIKGYARGSWYFEASFPIVLTNWDGLIIAQGYAQAQDDWMTQSYVPFEGTLTFEKPDYGENGFLILQKDNPSGLPENDDAVEIPVLFE